MVLENFENLTQQPVPAAGPVFPLPDVTLFPFQPLPLHIFEPRYRKMTADALAGDGCIAVTQMLPGPHKLHAERYHNVCGVGKIIHHEPLEDGGTNLVLLGLARVRLGGLLQERPYRVATYEVLRSDPLSDDFPDDLICLFRKQFRDYLEVLLENMAVPAHLPFADVNDVGFMTDIAAHLLPTAPADKQSFLEELDTGQRIRRMLPLVKRCLGALIMERLAGRMKPHSPSMN